MAVVSDQFDDCVSANGAGSEGNWRSSDVSSTTSINNGSVGTPADPEICGCTLSVRQSEDILSIWNKDGSDQKVNQKIKYVFFSRLNYVYLC